MQLSVILILLKADQGTCCINVQAIEDPVRLSSTIRFAELFKQQESPLYGLYGDIFGRFCYTADLVVKGAPNGETYFLLCCAQAQLPWDRKQLAKHSKRIPDFVVEAIQAFLLRPELHRQKVPKHDFLFLVEIKPLDAVGWYGDIWPVNTQIHEDFIHDRTLIQVIAQAHHAQQTGKETENTSMYGMLIVGVWFAVFKLGPFDKTAEPLPKAVRDQPDKYSATEEQLYTAYLSELFASFKDRLVIPPFPVFNEDWSALQPIFKYALQICSNNKDAYVVKNSHAFFSCERITGLSSEGGLTADELHHLTESVSTMMTLFSSTLQYPSCLRVVFGVVANQKPQPDP